MQINITDIIKTYDTEKHLGVMGLYGSAKGLLLARLARQYASRSFLVITPTETQANELINDCNVFFHPNDARRLNLFPESSTLPYSRLSPDSWEWAERLKILYKLLQNEPIVIIAPVAAIMRRLPPKKYIETGSRIIRLKEMIDPTILASHLTSYGYEDTSIVEDGGAFTRRGGILDLWPPTSEYPVRLEFDGDTIVSMRFFDPANQRSKGETREVTIIPVRDFPFGVEERKIVSQKIRARAEDIDIPTRDWRAITEAVNEGIAFSGIETLMPIFHSETATIFDYIKTNTNIIIDEDLDTEQSATTLSKSITTLFAETKSLEKIISPSEIMISWDELNSLSSKFKQMLWNGRGVLQYAPTIVQIESNIDLKSLIEGHKKNEDMLIPLTDKIRQWQEKAWRIVFTCHTKLQAERLIDLFKWHGLALTHFEGPFESFFETSAKRPHIRIAKLSSGFRWPMENLVIITDEEIFGSKVSKKTVTTKPLEPFTSFAELIEGDFLVHEKHGIGRYLGLVHMTIADKANDYLLIEYLGGDKLYLPVYRLNLVGRFIGSGDGAPILDRLGGTRWIQTQQKVNTAIRMMAKELLQIYASREIFPGYTFPANTTIYEEFAAAFPYDETPDQAKSIDDVMGDMSLEKPMDRLICGDVGYGKTEVAMRAAFRSAMSGKQVAVLVPTTILAFQHYETFTKRFKDTPVTIEMISRFRSTSEQKEILANLSNGKADIIIGTHRLIQKDIHFHDLGLLIIDEEHRFGVRHKERIKKLRSSVDVITLTATPIPRTLNLSLTGIRDISVINTPPADRLSIETHVTPFDEGIIRHAILKELARGGQIFFVHNRVETIKSMFERLTKIIPEARIVIGHGQLKEHELEKVMMEFIEKRADILLCTTIVESGLDIPSANTIIINRADTFGLAQLYQLRGRVGRSNVRAYAYLLIPEEGEISTIAKKRLTVLKRFTELGSGFQIAMHDLEFRGAGNILGRDQSGHIASIGYEMYSKLLEREIRKLKGQRVEEEIDPELSLKVEAYLPENFIPDPNTRLDIYKRLSSAGSVDDVVDICCELSDRFGELPGEALNLLGVMEIKVLAKKLKMKQITFDGKYLSCHIDATTPLKPDEILSFVTHTPEVFRLISPDCILIAIPKDSNDNNLLKSAKNSLMRLAGYVSEAA